jgi:hypothetical protein
MAGQRLTDKSALDENLASDDLLMCVDTSDTSGSSAGTSKKIDNKFVIQSDVQSLSSAQVNGMSVGGGQIELVAPPGSGYIVQPLFITCICTYVSSGNNGGYLYVSNQAGQTGNYLVAQRDFYKLETADRTFMFGAAGTALADGTYDDTIDNLGLYAYSNTPFTGDWTMKIITTYQIVKI